MPPPLAHTMPSSLPRGLDLPITSLCPLPPWEAAGSIQMMEMTVSQQPEWPLVTTLAILGEFALSKKVRSQWRGGARHRSKEATSCRTYTPWLKNSYKAATASG